MPLRGVRLRERHEPAAETGQQVDAREAGPLAVRLEQLRRLPALDRAAAQRREQLDESEIANQPVLVTAEPLEADDARRPGPEERIVRETGDDIGVVGVEPEHEAKTLDARLAVGAKPDDSVGKLPRLGVLGQPRLESRVAKAAGRVAGEPGGQGKRIRPARAG